MSENIVILEKLRAFATQTPDKLFIQTQEGSCSFKEFYIAAQKAARLIHDNIADGEVIGIYETKSIPFFTYLVGTWMAGKQAMPLNIRMPPSNIDKCIKKSRCVLTIGSAAQAAEGVSGSYLSMADAPFAQPLEPSRLNETDRAIIMFTSGSTGQPKAIPLTFDKITQNSVLALKATEMTESDKLLITMPPYFTSAICHFLTCILKGASVISTAGFSFGAQLFGFIDKYGATGFGGSPVNVRRALAAAKTGQELASIRFWVSSGDALAANEQSAFLSTFKKVRFIYMYGLSEVGGRLCVNDTRSHPDKVGAAGVPMEGMKVEVLDHDGKPLPAGETGELRVSGPLLMDGYLMDDGSILKSSTENGFMTGDIGYKDEDGFVWLIGRKDDVLKIGGEKVSTVHVETVLRKHVACRDSCVAIIDDPNLGKVLIALIVPEQDHAPIDQRKLYEALRRELPPNAIPAKVFEVPEIPRTGSGKVQKAEARALAYKMVRPA